MRRGPEFHQRVQAILIIVAMALLLGILVIMAVTGKMDSTDYGIDWKAPESVVIDSIEADVENETLLITFWLIDSSGHVTKWDTFVVRGSLAERKLIGFYLVDGVVRAAVGLDRGGDPELDLDGEMAACARLVSAQAQPAPAVLEDERTDLWSLSRG